MEELNKFSRKINWQLDLNWALALDYLLHLSREGLGVDCSQSPVFSWDRLDIPRLTVTGILIFKGTEGAGVGDYSSEGGGERGEGREK